MAAATKTGGRKGSTTRQLTDSKGRLTGASTTAGKKPAGKKPAKKAAAKKPQGRRAAAAPQSDAQKRAEAASQLKGLSARVRTGGHGSADVKKARSLAALAGVAVPAWAADKSSRSAAAKPARPTLDGRYLAAAKYAQDKLRGDGPRAPITGPNIAALESALAAAKQDPTFGNERALRAFATGGKDLPADLKSQVRAFIKDAAAPVDARTFYGQKLARMLVALVDDRAGKIKA